MADSKFDLNRLRESAGELVGSFKTMINPAGSVPSVDPNDALGVKMAQLSTLVKQLSEAQQEQVKNLNKVNQLLNAAFEDIEALRNQAKVTKPVEAVVAPVTPAPTEVAAPAPEEKKE